MATFAEIQSRVEIWLRDLPADTQAEIPSLINDAQRELQRQHNFRAMEASAVLTTVASVNALGTISDFKEPHVDPFWTDGDGATNRLDWETSLDILVQRFQADSVGAPRYVYWSALSGSDVSSFQVYPASDGLSKQVGGEYPITISYWKWIPKLVADADSNWFTVNADKYLRLHAIGWGHMLNLEEGRASAYLQAAEVEAARIISADKISRVKRPQALRYSVNAGAQVGFERPW